LAFFGFSSCGSKTHGAILLIISWGSISLSTTPKYL
jgi:hypothetical protein